MLYITSACVLSILFIWIVSLQRSLLVLDENVNSSISQIGIQISSCWDALGLLLRLVKTYDLSADLVLLEGQKKRRIITKDSTTNDIIQQEHTIEEVLNIIVSATERHPKLKMDKTYLKTINAFSQYEKMVHTSQLIYNDSVSKLNAGISLFPAIIVASFLGFSKRDYLDIKRERIQTTSRSTTFDH